MTYPRDVALDDFIGQLVRLRTHAGDPSLATLCRLSERLRRENPERRDLTESSMFDILAGRRRRWPDWRWIATYVEACHLAAAENGVDPTDLGGLQEWSERLRAAKAHAPHTVAEQHDPDNVTQIYGLGVLLCCDGRTADGRGHLLLAAKAGHPDALELYHSPRPEPAAGQAAYRIGRAYEETGQPSLARLFYRAAAKTGLTEAILRLDPADLAQLIRIVEKSDEQNPS